MLLLHPPPTHRAEGTPALREAVGQAPWGHTRQAPVEASSCLKLFWPWLGQLCSTQNQVQPLLFLQTENKKSIKIKQYPWGLLLTCPEKKKKWNEERKTKKKYFYPSMVDASDFTRPKQPLHALLLPQHPHTATPTPRTRPLPSQTARSPENKAWETLWPQRLVMTALFSGDKSCKGANCRHVF